MSDESEVELISEGSGDDAPNVLATVASPAAFVDVDDGVGSPGSNSDDVVIVESETEILAEDSNSEISNNGDDERGQEEEEEERSEPAQTDIAPILSTPATEPSSENEQAASRDSDNVSQPSSHLQESSSAAADLAVPGPSTSSQSQNTSLQDFQTPTLIRPAVPSVRLLADPDESVVHFRSPKRRRLMSPVKSEEKGESKEGDGDEEDEDDGDCCSICFEPWTNSGNHRLASLKCGHLFGMGCIEKWLKGQGGKCPQCNEKAKLKDVRVIYAKTIKMVDTSEKERALKELEQEKILRRKADLDAAEARLRCQQYMDESRRLREELDRVRGELSTLRSRSQAGGSTALSQPSQSQAASQQQELQGQFVLDKSIKIWEAGQCRVVDFCSSLAALVVSQPSSSPLFPGFGIKKISAMDFKTSSYMTLHTKAIRGVTFHPTVDDGILLSGSMDKTVKLTSMITNTVVQTYNTHFPVWSVEWNAENQNYFYAGQQNGTVLEFDTRNTSEHVRQLNAEGSLSPIVALQYITQDVNAAFRPGGLLVGQLNRTTFHQIKENDESRLHILPLEGNLISLHLDASTRHLLASFRPTPKFPSVRHQLCELSSTNTVGSEAVITCNVIHTFHGSRAQSTLAKTMLRSHPADNTRLLVIAGDETSNTAHIWDTATNRLLQRLPCEGMAVDFSSFTINNTTYLAALTERTLKVHRWC